MRATLVNLSPLPRDHWCTVTFPTTVAMNAFHTEATFRLDDGRKWRAVRGRTVKGKTAFRIFATMSGLQEVHGALLNEQHPTAAEFETHEWVHDDFHELLPNIEARVTGSVLVGSQPTELRMIDKSPAHQRWVLRRWIPDLGLHFAYWADLLHKDPVIPFRGKLVWSDRGDLRQVRTFDALMIRAGEAMVFDFAKRHGIVGPVGQGPDRLSLLASNIDIGDAMGLPLSGVMLGFVSGSGQQNMPEPLVAQSIRNLRAAARGPIVGSCDEWGAHEWLANAPRFDASYVSKKDEEWRQFAASLETYAGWTASRPVGLGEYPGQTGEQEDFGATKGTYIVTERDPRHIYRLQYAVQAELFRGTNHYGANGEPLSLDDHAAWVTLNGETHYHYGVSPDRLGKGDPPLLPPMGWLGYDDEHRSQNNLAAYMMLTDDPLMEDQVAHMATTDLAAYAVRFPQNGAWAARAQGRTVGALSHLIDVVPGEIGERLARCILVRMGASMASPSLSVTGPMKVLAWGEPDGRKPVFEADNATLGRWVSFWEHGLALVGLYNLTRTGGGPEFDQWRAMMLTLANTMRQFACFLTPGGIWHTVGDMLWSDGEAPPGGGLVVGSKQLTSAPNIEGVMSWTFAGLLVAREVLGGDPGLDDYVHSVTRGKQATTKTAAEWRAAVRD